MLNRPDLPPTHPINQIPAHLMQLGENKFEAKLTFDERCQCLALRRAGMSIGAIAVTFGVNRRTITHIANPESPRYANVRAVMNGMGEEAFLAKFATSELVQRVIAAASTREAQESYAENDSKPGSAKVGVPNPRATQFVGINVHKGIDHTFSHRIEVRWLDDPKGWFTKLLDVKGIDSEEFFGDPDQHSHLTSNSALAFAKAKLNDEYQG